MWCTRGCDVLCCVYIYMKIVQYLKVNLLMILLIQHWLMSDDVDTFGDLKRGFRD